MTGPVGLRQAAARLLGPCELIANLAEAVIRVETASGHQRDPADAHRAGRDRAGRSVALTCGYTYRWPEKVGRSTGEWCGPFSCCVCPDHPSEARASG